LGTALNQKARLLKEVHSEDCDEVQSLHIAYGIDDDDDDDDHDHYRHESFLKDSC
jgi:hypothetical protein